jgi:FG-GAP repeat protein
LTGGYYKQAMRAASIGWATVGVAAGFAASAFAQAPSERTSVLPISTAEGNFVGFPPSGASHFPPFVSPVFAEVGDVNGDGIADVAIGTPSADPRGRRDAGVVRILFGRSPLGRIDVRSSQWDGFRILGPRLGARRPAPAFAPDSPPRGAMAGTSVAGAGDVNGDGLGDVLLGAPYAGNRGRAFSGSVYVVFGRRSREAVDLARLGGWGYRIDGPDRGSTAGYTLAGPGDVSGDGRPDVVLSTLDAVRVVFGRAGTAQVDMRRSVGQGFAIRGRRPFLSVGAAVSGAGDFNGDGLADIAVGAPHSTVRHRAHAGATFVVFGARDSRSLNLAELGERGVRIDGEHEISYFGGALAPVGDLNGDGRGELLIGAPHVSAPERRYVGAAYVVFGRSDPGALDIRRPDGGAYRILGPRLAARGQGRAGVSVAATGDVNGDGRPDMIVGAPDAGRRCSPEEGAAYVVFGQPIASPLDMGRLGAAGYAIRGGVPDSNAGALVAGAGDWNGDGRGDALVLRAHLDDSRRRQRPRLDLVFGRPPPALPPPPTDEQLPRIEIPRPSLRRLASGRAITARVTVNESGPADAALVEVYAAALGPDLPVALGYANFSRPQTKSVDLTAPEFVRGLLRRRDRLRARVVVSQCTTAGHEYIARTRLVLRR